MTVRIPLVLLVLLLAASPAAAARKPDPLATARQFYNAGQFDQAIEAAREAVSRPATISAARLIMGRSRLERYRATQEGRELDDARDDLRAVDPAAIDARGRAELQVGLGELLYFEDRFGAAAELLGPVIDQAPLEPEARARALDWWASSLDRQALSLAAADRGPIVARVIARMEEELRRDPASAPAGYRVAAASRSAGDLDRAWSAAMAGWIRATLARDRGVALRTDLDKLVIEGIIPDRAARSTSRDRRQIQTALAAEWDAFKRQWSADQDDLDRH
jgi:tetratricopeptide (TPR) repeat protein